MPLASCFVRVGLGLLLAAALHVQAEQLPIKTYTTADGLAHDRVLRIVRDTRGFLWFCTPEGLSQFDGYHFTTYGPEQGLSNPVVTDLLETHRGVYWVATHGGVYRFNPSVNPPPVTKRGAAASAGSTYGAAGPKSQFTLYSLGNGPQTQRVNVLYEDRTGRVWAGTDGGLFYFAETSAGGTFQRMELRLPNSGNPTVDVSALVGDEEGSLWMGSSWGLVQRLPSGRTVHYAIQTPVDKDFVRAVLKDRAGRLWVSHDIGLCVFIPEPATEWQAGELGKQNSDPPSVIGHARNPRWYTTADGLGSHIVRALYQSSDGRIWIGTNNSLSEFDGQRFHTYTTAKGCLGNATINGLTEDRDGNLWIGTDSGGALRMARNGFITYRKDDGLGHTYIASIFENQAGELCVMSGALVLNRFDGERFTALRINVPDPIASLSYFRTVLQDHAGEWWVTTRQGLYRFPRVQRIEEFARTRPKAVYTTRDGLADNALLRLYEDARGDLWIGTHSPARHALTRWERATGAFHRYAEADGLPSPNAAVSFCEDRAGNLWIGFSEGGLARYRGGRFMLLMAADGLPAGEITALYLDHAGRLWAGSSQGGLGRVDDPTAERPRVVTYTTAEGLASRNVRCLTEDQWGRLYIGTISGVDRLDPATGRIKHYTKAEGLAGELTAAFRDRYHALWFGAWDGLSRLIPEPDRPSAATLIFIGGLRLAGFSYPISALGETEVAKLELTASQNHVQIDFFGLGFGLGDALRYQYRMEGMDKDWGPPTDQRSVHYLGLPPGAYRFMVRAVNTDGLTSATPAVVTFTVLPPIWQRWWFILLVAMGMSFLVYAFYHYRVARVIELERVRTRIATDLHDDVGSSLSQVAILGEVAKQQIREAPLGAAATVTEITETAREVIDAMSDIVWSIDPRRDDLNNLVIRIRKFATNLFEGHGIAWDFKTPSELENIKLTPEQRRHLLLIFKEAIHNIVRHAGATAVTLHLAVADHQLMAEIRFQQTGPPGKLDHDLTPQEVRLLGLLAEGYSYQAAADRLKISINTIRDYIRAIYEKLHVHSKAEAVRKALKSRIIF